MMRIRCILPIAVSATAVILAACGDARRADDAGGADSSVRSTSAPRRSAAALTGRRDSVAPSSRRYGVRSGVVEYRNSDGAVRQTLYFDDYGAREALYTEFDENSDSASWPFRVLIHAGGERYAYNPGSPDGRRAQVRPGYGAMLGTLPNAWGDPEGHTTDGGVRGLEMKEIAGKEAQGYAYTVSGERYSVWAWERVPLYVELRWGNDPRERPTVVEAVSIRTDIEIPAERFRPPADLRFNDAI